MFVSHCKQADGSEVTSVSISFPQHDTCLNFSEYRELCYLAFFSKIEKAPWYKLEPHASEHLQEAVLHCDPPKLIESLHIFIFIRPAWEIVSEMIGLLSVWARFMWEQDFVNSTTYRAAALGFFT